MKGYPLPTSNGVPIVIGKEETALCSYQQSIKKCLRVSVYLQNVLDSPLCMAQEECLSGMDLLVTNAGIICV